MLREMSLTVALLFIASGVLTNAQNTGGKEKVVSAGVGGPLTVECPLRVEQLVEWRLNGSRLPDDIRAAGEQPAGEGRMTARLHAAQARPHHAGLYTCSSAADAQRIRVRLQPAPAAPAPAAPPRAAPAGEEPDFLPVKPALLYYDINRNLSLTCPLTSSDKTAKYIWKKNDKPLEEVPGLKERYVLEEGEARLRLSVRTNEEDYGNYSCAVDGELHAWDVRGRPVARLPDDTSVVENQKIVLQCKVIGKPTPLVTWAYSTEQNFTTAVPLGEGDRDGRVTVRDSEHGVPGAALELASAARADAGVYWCRAGDGSPDHTTLRVKDMYAALWPFLGICAEVFVLCAIILVYEKRRTKPELDDSDTDNHDQKKS